jgi:hypothetical protein
MKKQSSSKIIQQRRRRQWLHWELLQRATRYTDAVVHFLSTIQELSQHWQAKCPSHPDLPVSIDSQTFRTYYDHLQECMQHVVACERIVTTYERLTRRLVDLTPQERTAVVAWDGEDYKTLRDEVLGIVTEGCLIHNLWGCTDLLQEFRDRWGLMFPLNPKLSLVVWELVLLSTQPPVRLDSWTSEGAMLWIPFNLSRKRVLAEIGLTLDGLDRMAQTQGRRRPHRDKDNFQGISNPREYYQESLKVYDLGQQGWTALAIAEQLWPAHVAKDRADYGKEQSEFRSIQKVYDRCDVIKDLLTKIEQNPP